MMTQNYIFKIFFAFFILFTITPLVVGQFFGQDHFIRFAESFIFVWPILSTLYLLFFIIWIFIMEQQKKYFLIFFVGCTLIPFVVFRFFVDEIWWHDMYFIFVWPVLYFIFLMTIRIKVKVNEIIIKKLTFLGVILWILGIIYIYIDFMYSLRNGFPLM